MKGAMGLERRKKSAKSANGATIRSRKLANARPT